MKAKILILLLALATANSGFAAIHYVDLSSLNPTPPYTNWATAATMIQDAVEAAALGDEVVVTNGTYATGGGWSRWGGDGSNRVAALKALTIRSVNGPGMTSIDGAGSMRCVYLTTGASISGFTITNGFIDKTAGGGVFCGGSSAVVSNCVIISNSVYGFSYDLSLNSGEGGGAYGGTLYNCALIGNSVHGYFANIGMDNLVFAAGLGGGAANCSLSNCVLIGNSAYAAAADHADAPGEGGGVANCNLYGCVLIGNYADDAGGGAAVVYDFSGDFNNAGMWDNCTFSRNSASYGGGVCGGTLNNCIVYSNTAQFGGNYQDLSTFYGPGSELNYCCTFPMPTNGFGNITNAPLFVDVTGGNLRLQSNSPCVNAGKNTYAPTGPELDDNPRISGGTVDIGAYEFQNPASIISYAWLQQYGFPTDGSVDFTDSDGDGINNWREWRCQTDPTDFLSALRLLAPVVTPTNVIVTWQSVVGVSYFLERNTNLAAPASFTTVATNIFGQPGATTCLDTNATGSSLFYRVGVQ